MSERPCTCHPDDNPPVPCPRKYALSECRAAAERSTSRKECSCDDTGAPDLNCSYPHRPDVLTTMLREISRGALVAEPIVREACKQAVERLSLRSETAAPIDRDSVLEEAAIVCEEWPSSPLTAQKVTCLELATAIRRLKSVAADSRRDTNGK